MPSERTPLLWNEEQTHARSINDDVHMQFCALIGCPPSNAPDNYHHRVNKNSLFGRATRELSSQRFTYLFSASLSNSLLLLQVVLGAALTALGASASSPLLVTLFGATNTVIAGLIAYMKSRGQPMRSRMYRDDLERVVDEIENSETMWLGISKGVHGYDEIDTESEVTVRSEVARLTRLYERATRNNTMNNPDMYSSGGGGDGNIRAGLRSREPIAVPSVPAVAPMPAADASPLDPVPAPIAIAPVAMDPDVSPASKPPNPEAKKDDSKKPTTTEPSSGPVPKDTEGDKGKTADAEPASTPNPTPVSQQQPQPTPTPTPAPAPAQQPTPQPRPQLDPDASPASRPSFSGRKSSKSPRPTDTPPKSVSNVTEAEQPQSQPKGPTETKETTVQKEGGSTDV